MNTDDKSWMTNPTCHEATRNDPALAGAWINEQHPEREVARSLCHLCEFNAVCLEDALNDSQAEGLRAGYWFSSGALLSKDKERLKQANPMLGSRARVRQQYKTPRITNGEMAS